ncbi:MAG: ABC transporter ATP-binding protein [Acidimicrobiales bacterium]|jgi:putative ABC transport system ATP-binding protein
MTDSTNPATTDGSAGGEPLYVLQSVERTFTKGGVSVHALRGINLTLAAGEMVALEGPSGSGKTTLLQLLGALDVPTAGSIRFAGRELENASDRVLTRIRSEEIGFVFQHFNLIPTLTARENVWIAMVPGSLPHEEQVARASELLRQVGLGHRLTHLPSRLSGGEQQRVAIARALANKPRVVIADEPTGNLDSETGLEVIDLLSELRDVAGVTVILATHDEEIGRRAERRVRMRDGSIVEDRAATGILS